MKSNHTAQKLLQIQNRVNCLNNEQLRARNQIQQTIAKGHQMQNIRKQKIEHNRSLNNNSKLLEKERQDNNRKITLMRNNIKNNISSQRNSVFNTKRKIKNEVVTRMNLLKQKRHSDELIEDKINSNKRLSIMQNKSKARTNQSIDLFATKSNALEKYDKKIEYNLQMSKDNQTRIKKLEELESQLMAKLNQTYLEHDNIVKQFDLKAVTGSVSPLRETTYKFKDSTHSKLETDESNQQLTDMSMSKQSKKTLNKLAVFSTHRHTRAITANNRLNGGRIDQHANKYVQIGKAMLYPHTLKLITVQIPV